MAKPPAKPPMTIGPGGPLTRGERIAVVCAFAAALLIGFIATPEPRHCLQWSDVPPLTTERNR